MNRRTTTTLNTNIISMGSGIPREILKWLQTLELQYQIKNPKRDLSNGYIVADIFSRHEEFSSDISTNSFENGLSLKTKLNNWELLMKFFKKHNVPVTKQQIDDVIQNKPTAGVHLLEVIYCFITKKKLRMPGETASAEKPNLPTFARPTASKLIKEAKMELDETISKSQAASIVEKHKHETREPPRKESPQKVATKSPETRKVRH